MKPIRTALSDSGRQYCLEEQVGAGSYGKVFRGHDVQQPQTIVAIKYARDLNDREAFNSANSRIMREAGFLMNISNPHVVRYHDVCTGAPPYVVLEYIPNTLASLPPTQSLIMKYIRQVPDILEILDQSHIAHCDLKADNTGYSRGMVKLLDFGLAIPFEHAVCYPKNSHKLYQAPEFRKWDLVTRTSDTYSAGRIIEWLATGGNAGTSREFEINLAQACPEFPPRSFLRLVRKMLQNDHARRPSIARLRELAGEALEDLGRKEYFTCRASSGIHFFGSATASSA